MVSHPKTPILNCFYHLLWSYFVTVSEFSCLAKSFSVWSLKSVRTPVAILGSFGVCIYVPASRHWLISYSPIHLT